MMRKAKDRVKIEFISSGLLDGKSMNQKIDYLIEAVRNETILVLDNALTNDEKKELISRSMEIVDENFSGIEFSEIVGKEDFLTKIINYVGKLFGKEVKKGIAIVGSSNVLEKIKESKEFVSLVAKVR